MPTVRSGNTDIFYESSGRGEPLVLIHGSWGDHFEWQALIPCLTETFRVVAYDRRGHSQSESGRRPGSRREDEDDLAALMSTLDCAPGHLVGNSFGGSIALGLAARRPDLIRTVMVHEPPLFAAAANDAECRSLIEESSGVIREVLEKLSRGDDEEGFRQFVDEIALGPGAFQHIPDEMRRQYIRNAPTFMDEQRDSDWANIDMDALADISVPVLLTKGDQSPRLLQAVLEALSRRLNRAEVVSVPGAGHLPHVSHPEAYAALMRSFISRASVARESANPR
ncbi:MAG: alpha/beta fold hydrolase [Chloroflexota bacterium]